MTTPPPPGSDGPQLADSTGGSGAPGGSSAAGGSGAPFGEDRTVGRGELLTRMRTQIGRPVDTLHIAAVLEADGVTDQSAQDVYGHEDVFRLAEDLFATLDEPSEPVPPQPASRVLWWKTTIRDVSHGLLYLLPSALLPLALTFVGHRRLAVTLIAVSALGWVWSAAIAGLAYRMLGRGLRSYAGLVLRLAALCGPALGAATGLTVAVWIGGGPQLIVIGAGLLVFQTASTIALVYRAEIWLFATMAPGVGAGLANLFYGVPSAPITGGIGLGSLVLSLGLMAWLTTRPLAVDGWPPASSTETSLLKSVGPELARLWRVLLYAALSAAFLLHVDARYLSSPLGLAIAAAPLIVGMGFVEWRVHRFHDRASALLHRVSYPWEFKVAVWRRLAIELFGLLSVIGTLAVALIVTLERTGHLTNGSAALIAAHVAVAGAYFLAFLVAGQGQYGRLNAALATALGLQVALVWLLPGGYSPRNDGLAFLASAIVLQGLLLSTLSRDLGQVWQYRR
jgi:hypothetical protein